MPAIGGVPGFPLPVLASLLTQISFMSSQEMNGRILTCLSVIDATTIVTSEVTLAISENNSK